MKNTFFLFMILLLTLGYIIPAQAVTGSSTSPAKDSITAFAVPLAEMSLDYEHSLNESSALNVSWCTFPILSILGSTFSGGDLDYNLNIIDVSYKHYFDGAQNGLYCGANLMYQIDEQTVKSTGVKTTKYAAALGASAGFRKITASGFTYDLGAALYIPSNLIGDDTVAGGYLRLNLGYGW